MLWIKKTSYLSHEVLSFKHIHDLKLILFEHVLKIFHKFNLISETTDDRSKGRNLIL